MTGNILLTHQYICIICIWLKLHIKKKKKEINVLIYDVADPNQFFTLINFEVYFYTYEGIEKNIQYYYYTKHWYVSVIKREIYIIIIILGTYFSVFVKNIFRCFLNLNKISAYTELDII